MADRRALTRLNQHREIAALGLLRHQRAAAQCKAADEKVQTLAAEHDASIKAVAGAETAWMASLSGGVGGGAISAFWATELLRQDALCDYRAALLTDAREEQEGLEKARRTAEARERIGQTLLRRARRVARQSEEEARLADMPVMRRGTQ